MPEFAQGGDDWIKAARAGSNEALGYAFQACRNYLLLIANQELDPEMQARGGASDLVQETFLEAKRDFGRFRGMTNAELVAWLRQILINNVANFTQHHRALKRGVNREIALDTNNSDRPGNLALPDPMHTPGSQAVEREQSRALHLALERLPADYRQVVVLRCLENRSFEEIASRMNRSTDAVRKLWSRAMKRLQHEWEGPK